jgi:4-diphosphocytidyl-2-C-methyl-D-erythritol kinase
VPRRVTGVIALRARAPAKVNLVLRVGPRRPDGFHELATLMVPLDLADDVVVRAARGRRGRVSCRVPGRPELDGPANLAARAAEAFRKRFGVADRVDLTVEKRVPVTAGLGGGSSDAAAVLRALARIYAIDDREALLAVGLEIGSDVPFFLGRGPAWARGRGERLVPADVAPQHLVLLYPRDEELAIRAADAYRWLDEARGHRAGCVPIPAPRWSKFTPRSAQNDLEGPCFARHPLLRALTDRLVGQGAKAAILSGSGPTVFGVFNDRAAARRAALLSREAGAANVEVHVVRSLQRHPGVSRWKSPRSASSRSTKRSSGRT